MGHWKNECPNRKPTALELEESVTEGHETQPWVTLKVEGKLIDFSGGHWYTHSILKQSLGPCQIENQGYKG